MDKPVLLSGPRTERQVRVHFDMLAVPLPLTRPYDQLGPEMEPMGRLRTIPRGRVTTYGALCKALGMGSPRSGAFHRSCVCHI